MLNHSFKKFFICSIFCFFPLMLFAARFSAPLTLASQNFLLISAQKTGTHLISKALQNLTDRNDYFYTGSHAPGELRKGLNYAKANNMFLWMHANPAKQMIHMIRKQKYKIIFMWRDPRDQIISLLHKILEGGFPSCIAPKNKPHFHSLTFEEQLHELITGDRYGISWTERMMLDRMGWLEQDPKLVYVCKFEKLVGEEGGGTRKLQIKEIQNIANHLHLNLTKDELKKRSEDIFGHGKTFRSGLIGSWKKDFTPYLKKAFKERFNDMLIRTGYEKDDNW